jgi:membrane-associated phospholipid phosphatase
VNRRPNGSYKGFPSGHTAAAFYGASYLSRRCVRTRGQKALLFGLAAFVGGSRIHADKHTAAQVVAGALVGLMFDNVAIGFQDNRVRVGWRMEF